MRRLARVGVVLAIPTVVVGLSQLHGSHLAPNPYEFTRTGRLSWAIAYIALLYACSYIAGLPSTARSVRSAVVQAVGAVSAAALGISAVQLVVGDALLPRVVVFGSAALIVPILVGLSVAHHVGIARRPPGNRVFLMADELERSQLVEDLGDGAERPATLVGWLDSGSTGWSSHRELVAEIRDTGADLLVLDVRAQAAPQVVAAAAELHEAGIRVRTLSLFYEEWLGKLPVSELERVSLLFDVGEVHRARYARAKRILDVLVAAAGLVALLLALPVVWVGNLVANRGPLFFRQERIGKGGKIFTIVKFRTMVPGADNESWTRPSDPRVTPFGGFLRTTHIDELPQLLNILRGDLSLVGPRPEQPRYVEELATKLPFYRIRHLVRPGLTGWAQVQYGYSGDERDALEKLQYEFFYLRRQGWQLDAKILARTPRSIFSGKGRGR